jgi:hypothetical protein
MASFSENFGIFGVYTHHLPWHDLRGATFPDSGERPYTISKTFVLMTARELARRLEGSGVDVFAGAGWLSFAARRLLRCAAEKLVNGVYMFMRCILAWELWWLQQYRSVQTARLLNHSSSHANPTNGCLEAMHMQMACSCKTVCKSGKAVC